MNIYDITFTNNDGELDYTQLDANSEEEAIALLWTMEKEYDLKSVDEIEMVGDVRYYVSALAYDYNHRITDFKRNYGNFEDVEDAYQAYRKVVDEAESDRNRFFENTDDSVWYWKVQLEMCEEFNEDCVICKYIDAEEDIYRDTSNLIRFELEIEEASAIDHVMSATRMDCWFLLEGDDDNMYYVRDLERGSLMRLDEALGQALDGFIDLKMNGVTEEEIEILANVAERLGIIDDAKDAAKNWA